MNQIEYKNLKLYGETGALVERIIDNWLLNIRQTNPAIIDMFRDRDVKPYRDLLPWSGEFAGKYITSSYYAYKLTGRRDLYDYIIRFIDELLQYQDEDGYMGCFAKDCRLTGAYSQDPSKNGCTWDAWSHYHFMFGMLLWYNLTGKENYLQAIEKTAGLFMNKFYGDNPGILATGSSEMNLAVYHVFCLLFRRTKNPDYLAFAKQIEGELSDEGAGDYINYSLKGYEFYQCPKPRWESLHIIMGLAEMYRITEEDMYLSVAAQIFYSILKTDVHNTGAFSTNEQAVGHPYQNAAIETCCVVAYNALGIDLYALTGDSKIIDFLERSHYNAVLGYNSPTGRWSTYDTPMEGTRCASYHSVVFQCRPGSPELNCCSVNAPRGVASVSEWLAAEDNDTLFVNFYENMHAETADGITIDIKGAYPEKNKVYINIDTGNTDKKIAFRIPGWSKNTVILAKEEIFHSAPGTYFVIENTQYKEFAIEFDFTPYTEAGGGDYTGKCSIYVGPILYGFDNGKNHGIDFENIPAIPEQELKSAFPVKDEDGSLCLKFASGIVLTDFYHLGIGGSYYKTWFLVEK